MRKANTAVGTAWECYNQLIDPATYARKRDSVLRSIVRWFFSKRLVQEELVNVFSGNTPMCRLVFNTLEDAMRGITVDVDNVEGMERYIGHQMDDALRDFNVDADNVEGLDKYLEEQLESLQEEIADKVVRELVDRLRG